MSNNANTNKAPNGASNGNKREPMVMLKLSYPQYRAVVKALKCANKGDQATLEAIDSQLRGLGNVIAKRFPNGFKYPTNANNGNNAPAAANAPANNNGNNAPANNNDVAGGAKTKKAKKSPAKRSKSPAKKAKKSPAKKAKKSPAKKAKKSPAKKVTRGHSKTPKRSKSPAKRSKSPKKATKAKRH